jgi:O-acetyl-ADP-ribose deacetylase (regulator of RNase III)
MLYLDKDITTVQAPALIAHGVNCSDAMGSGVARAIYMKWPTVKAMYHSEGSMRLGDAQIVEVEDNLVVANCFTQSGYGREGLRYACTSAIKMALSTAACVAMDRGLDKVYIPRIGCGLGGLDWEEDVVPALLEIEKHAPINFVICDIEGR